MTWNCLDVKKPTRKESVKVSKDGDAIKKSASKKLKKTANSAGKPDSPRSVSDESKDKEPKDKEPGTGKKKALVTSTSTTDVDQEGKETKKAKTKADSKKASPRRPKSMMLPKSPVVSPAKVDHPPDSIDLAEVPSMEKLKQDAAEISFSVSSSPEPSPKKPHAEPALPPKQEPATLAASPPTSSVNPATVETPAIVEAPTKAEVTPATDSAGAAAPAPAATPVEKDEVALPSVPPPTETSSAPVSARDNLTDSSTSDSSSAKPATGSDGLVQSNSVQNMIKKFSNGTPADSQSQSRSVRTSSNASKPSGTSLKPGSSGSSSSHGDHRRDRRGSASSSRSHSHSHSHSSRPSNSSPTRRDPDPSSVAVSPSSGDSQQPTVAFAPPAVDAPTSAPTDGAPETGLGELKKDPSSSHVTISVIRRHSSKDVRHGSLGQNDSVRSRTSSGSFSRENSRGLSSSSRDKDESGSNAGTPGLERKSSDNLVRSNSRELSDGTPDVVKLKDDLRRYREGYDYYKYKFKEAEQWLAKEGLETFKKEFDERRRRLRDMEDTHKKDQAEITELKAKVAALEAQLKAEQAGRKVDAATPSPLPSNNSSKDLSLSSSSNSLSESGSKRPSSFRGPPITTSSAQLLAVQQQQSSAPATPTPGSTTPTSVIPMTPTQQQKSKGFKIDLNATLADLSLYRHTKKPVWLAGKELDHRTRVALEMLDTEQSYVLGLSVLLENYLKPLLKYCKHEPKILESDVNKIFADGSLEGISVLNARLLDALEERLAQWLEKDELGDIFDKFAPLLKPYGRYGSRYEECLQHVTELQKANPKFKKVFDFYDEHAFRFSGLRLKDYMIMPVQRVPRFVTPLRLSLLSSSHNLFRASSYTMLLRDLLKHTPEGHPDLVNLQSACKKVEDVATSVNEGIRQAESQTKMAAIIERGGGFEALMKNYRSFIKSGTVPLLIDMADRKKGAKKDGEILIFNDIVVSGGFVSRKAEQQEYAQVLPLVWVSKDLDEEQATLIESEGFDPATGWTIRGPVTTWVVVSKDATDRNNWINTFAEILGCSVEDVSSGERKGKYEFLHPTRGVYDGEWLDGGFFGKGTYIRHDGVLFDGHWDYRFQGGFGMITSGTQSISGWRSYRPNGEVEPHNDEFGIFVSSALTERDWSLLMTGAKEQVYQKGSRIISQGQVNTNLYRIKTGTCRVEKTNDAGERIQLATMGPKTMFGDTAIVPSLKVATADVVADSDNTNPVEVYQIEVHICYEILKSNPGLSMRFYKQMALKLSQRLRNLHAPPPQKLSDSKKAKKAKKASAASAGQAGEAKDAPSAAAQENEMEKSKDRAFTEKFDLDESEIPIKEYECQSKGVVRKYGTMYITSHHICFDATVFGMSSQEVIKLDRITGTEVKNKKELRIAVKGKKWAFSFETGVEEVHSLVESLRPANVKDRRITDELGEEHGSFMKRKTTMKDVNGAVEGITLSKEDWALVQRGFKLVTFKKDEDVIREGTEMQRIYQIAKGTCRIQITHPTEGPKVVGSMEAGALFGEMSFLEGKGATASVIADSDSVEMYILEGHFINTVFVAYPDLSGRFYAYLASVIAERLNARERAIAKAAKKSKKAKEKEKEAKEKGN